MSAESVSVLDIIQGALPPEGPHTLHHLTVSLEGALGTQPRTRFRKQGGGFPGGRLCADGTEQKAGCV